MTDRLPPSKRRRFYTKNIVVEYATESQDAANNVDPALPAGGEQLVLADGITHVGTLESDINNLPYTKAKGEPIPPAYVQKVGFYAEFFFSQWHGLYGLRDPRTPDPDAGGEPRVQYRILKLSVNGLTDPSWTFIKLKPSLDKTPVTMGQEIQDDVGHELMHRIQYLYNDASDQVGIYGAFREGGAVFGTECINGALNRYVAHSKFMLGSPQGYSLTEYESAKNYAFGLLWKYIAEQYGAGKGQGAAELEVFRVILEETATVGFSGSRPGYSIEALRQARQKMSGLGDWDRFSYLPNPQAALDSHETTWGNYLLANYLHGSANPVSDQRFDYLEDNHPVNYFIGFGDTLSRMPNGVNSDNDFLIGQNDPAIVRGGVSVKSWSAWYYRVRPKLPSPPRMMRIQFVASSDLADPLVQIIKLGPGNSLSLDDVHRSDSTIYSKTVNMSSVEEIVVVVAGRNHGGNFDLSFAEVASVSDVMCTRWNTLTGTEFEVDPRNDAWTWLSPDIMVGNDVVGNTDGTVFAGWDNDLRIRLRNKGNTDANGIQIRVWCWLEPNGPWQPVTDSLGVIQERTNESLFAGSEAWFDMVWAPAPLSLSGVNDVWTLKVEVTVDGDANQDNKIALSRCLATSIVERVPSLLQLLMRYFVWLVSFGLIPQLKIPSRPPTPGPLPIGSFSEMRTSGMPGVVQREGGPVRRLALPPGLDKRSLVTRVWEVDSGKVSGVTYGVLRDASPVGDLLREVSGLACRVARQKNLPGKVVRWIRRQTMRTLTWQMVSVLTIIVTGLVIVYVATDDQETRMQLIGYFDHLVPFVIGAVTGSAVAGTTAFLKGRGVL